MESNVLNGAASSANWARKIAGPLIDFMALCPSCVLSSASGFRPLLAQKLAPELVDLIAVGEEVAPDPRRRRQVWQSPAEGFDHAPAVIAALFERLHRRRPGNVALARRAAIVLGEVDVIDVRYVRRDDPNRVLLLDVSMECVVQESIIRLAHLSDDVGGIRDRIEHVALEAVQGLDRKFNVVSRRIGGGVFMHADDVRPFGSRRGLARKDAERLIERPAKRLPARSRQTVDCPFEMIESGGADCRICAGAIALGVWDDGDCGSPKAVVTDRLSHLSEMLGRPLEDWKLNTVVPRPLDGVEEGKVLFGDVRRPQEHVEA